MLTLIPRQGRQGKLAIKKQQNMFSKIVKY